MKPNKTVLEETVAEKEQKPPAAKVETDGKGDKGDTAKVTKVEKSTKANSKKEAAATILAECKKFRGPWKETSFTIIYQSVCITIHICSPLFHIHHTILIVNHST